MQELTSLQKEFAITSRTMEWERELKSWDWKTYFKQKLKRVLTAQEFASAVTWFDGSPGAVRMHDLEDTDTAVQNRAVQLLQNQGKHIKKSVLIQQAYAKSHIVIDIKPNAQLRLDFANHIFDCWGNVYIRVGKNAKVEIHDTHVNNSHEFSAGSVFAAIGAGAKVHYWITTASKQTYQSHYVFDLAKSVNLTILQDMHPDVTQLHTHHVVHSGVDTQTRHTWILDARKHAQVYGNIVNYHKAKQTTADVVVKAVGRDQAQVKVDGWIDIGKRALDTNSYLQQDVLLLSEKANIRAVPNLEILNNDVVASHGATIGMVDEQQLRYLQSRGLSKLAAEKIIVQGFLNSGRARYTT